MFKTLFIFVSIAYVANSHEKGTWATPLTWDKEIVLNTLNEFMVWMGSGHIGPHLQQLIENHGLDISWIISQLATSGDCEQLPKELLWLAATGAKGPLLEQITGKGSKPVWMRTAQWAGRPWTKHLPSEPEWSSWLAEHPQIKKVSADCSQVLLKLI